MIELEQTMKPTSIEELKQYKQGNVVRLPDFGEGQPFYAVLQRPSLMRMVTNGAIPNELLTKVNEMFSDRVVTSKNLNDVDMLKNMYKVLDTVCDACFVSPTYRELKEAKMELTDDQMLFVFSYCQSGVKALESFRPERTG